MNRLLVLVFVFNSLGCKGQAEVFNPSQKPFTMVNTGCKAATLGKNIDAIFQDKNGNYWFASNGEGIFRYDGHGIQHFTTKEGLCSDFVWNIQEDVNGQLWMTTRDGICSYDGLTFTDYTDIIDQAPRGKLNAVKGGLFFDRPNKVCYYDGNTFTNFTIYPTTYQPSNTDLNRPYSVYSTLVDHLGQAWFGTQSKGVSYFDGHSFHYITEKNLAGPAVRTIYQDKKGNLWFGNNGGGLFLYDGNTLANIAEENNLGNAEFLNNIPQYNKQANLARVWAINEDNLGNLWVGTIDSGLWKFDGKTLTNYNTKNGLPGNAIWVLYKDKHDTLWGVIDGESLVQIKDGLFYPVALAIN